MTEADDGQMSSEGTDHGKKVGLPDRTGGERVSPTPIPTSPVLESLASRYEPEQHGSYLRHLQEALKDPRNLNVALTGRYGAGKSSVLDQLERNRKKTTLRLAIATLGPNTDDVTLTNRIQKELVKQLLYRAAPHDFPFSRFNRIVPLSRTRAVVEALGVVAVVGSILAFLRLLPAVAGTGTSYDWPLRVLAWLGFAALAAIVLATLRLVVYGRFVVSNFSAAGAAVTLTQRNTTYFDEYLEEIVYFFDKSLYDVVIFEDLDRFDDPHIFEALRELNILLNNTAGSRKKGKPVRFIYAIKDSLFEQLGSDLAQEDAAATETVRANHTKFFDVVIPLVPFISHRNARELLIGLLENGGVTDIDRPLVALVAQHVTDMRLLRNICNEYAVFAERLLASDRTAPGLAASKLFALVTYKNFHLRDFEEISRRNSDLDVLYDRRRDLVRASIERCEKDKRDLLNEPGRYSSMGLIAEQLGHRLMAVGSAFKANSGVRGWPYLQFVVGQQLYLQEQIASYDFWTAVAEAGAILIRGSAGPPGQQQQDVGRLERNQVEAIFPEASDTSRWAEIDLAQNQVTLDRLNGEIEFLRGADFKDLVAEHRFTLSTSNGHMTFADIVDTTVKSQLGRGLVRQGYLDRNFTLYAAQFYGDFTGVDVATFMIQNVQSNKMEIDFQFDKPESIANLFAEAPEDFSQTISAYNIAVLNYLLERDDVRAVDVAETVASNFGGEARAFLEAYFNSGSERARLAALLSRRPWPSVFIFLTRNSDIPVDIRPVLVDAALCEAMNAGDYELNSEVRDFIVTNYLDMTAFTSHHDEQDADRIVALVKDMKITFPQLSGLDETIRDRVVREDLYVLTADNLRAALGVTGGVSLDRARENANVYDFCLRSPQQYLKAIEEDFDTPHAILAEATPIDVLNDVASLWQDDDVHVLIQRTAPASELERVDKVPQSYWPYLAASHRFRSTAHNVRTYIDAIGSLDQSLGSLLAWSRRTDGAGEDEAVQMTVAIDILNAAGTMPNARQRVDLAASLHLDQPISPSKINPEDGDLLALLLEHKLVDDGLESFAQFRAAGWGAIEPAIDQSAKFSEFMTPELVNGLVAELLSSDLVPQQARDSVIDKLAQYVPSDDAAALEAAARYALTRGRPLPLDQLRRVAATTPEKDLTLRLLVTPPLLTPSDIVAILTILGEPYIHLTDHAVNEFEVSFEEHRAILDYLKEAGVISDFRKRRMQNVAVVKLT